MSSPSYANTNLFAEYIGQLEGELALKNQETATLRNENQSILAENERYRGLIETLLRHPAFSPFINDISQNPQQLFPQAQQQQQRQQQQQPQQSAVTPTPQQTQSQAQQQDMKPEFPDFDASQLQIPMSQQEQQHTVNLVTIPEEPFNKLNLYGNQNMNFNNYNSVNAYAVTECPTGPDPVDLLMDSPAYLPPASSTAASSTTFDSGLDLLFAKLDRAAQSLAAGQ